MQSNTAPLFVPLHIVFGVVLPFSLRRNHLIKLSFRGIVTKSGMFCQMDFPCTGFSVISQEKTKLASTNVDIHEL